VLLRLIGVAAFGAAPIAALDTTPAAGPIVTGDALAGPGVGFDNTGGNVSLDNGEVVQGPAGPTVVPLAPALGSKALIAPVKPVNPAADAIARANKLVADARARAQAQIDAARAQAAAAVAQAHQQAADAQARSQAQSDAARQQSADASAQARS
jgi:hypothetical protein